MSEKTVDGYIKELEQIKGEIVTKIRQIILDVSPDIKESIKWAQPVYENNGPFAYIKALKNDVNLGFWRGIDIVDPKGILQGSGEKMRHIKLKNLTDIDENLFSDFVRQAIELNNTKGDPTKGN
jgi:hypothetical protein